MKPWPIAVFIALAGLVSLSCGTVNVDLHTTVETSGDVVQEVKLVSEGLIAAALKGAMPSTEKLRKEGWQVESKSAANSFEQTWKRRFKRDETLDMVIFPDDASAAGATGQPKVTYYLRDSVFLKEYEFRVDIPPSPDMTKELQGLDLPQQQAAKALVESLFSLSWTITVPGEIVSTNADRREKNSATWDLTVSSLEKGRQLNLKARYINWPLIAGASLVLVAIGAFLALRLLRRKKVEVHQA